MLHAERNVIRALISWISQRDSDSDNNSRTTISERIASTKKDTMPRTLPWLTGDAVKKEATPQKRAIKRDPDPESDHEETPKASKDIGYSDKSDILKSCKNCLDCTNCIRYLQTDSHFLSQQQALLQTLSDAVHRKSKSHRSLKKAKQQYYNNIFTPWWATDT